MVIIMILTIAVSLSMDAFSLALAYGTLNLSKKEIRVLSFIVGAFHFIMPLIGMMIGVKLLEFIPIKPQFIIFLVLLIIGIQMMIESTKKEKVTKMVTFSELLLFGFAVSIDSFSVGIGLKSLTSHFIIASLTFSICSFFFTYLGLMIGAKINTQVGSLSTLFGGIMLLVIGFVCLIH